MDKRHCWRVANNGVIVIYFKRTKDIKEHLSEIQKQSIQTRLDYVSDKNL